MERYQHKQTTAEATVVPVYCKMANRCVVCKKPSTQILGLCRLYNQPSHSKCAGKRNNGPCNLCRNAELSPASQKYVGHKKKRETPNKSLAPSSSAAAVKTRKVSAITSSQHGMPTKSRAAPDHGSSHLASSQLQAHTYARAVHALPTPL